LGYLFKGLTFFIIDGDRNIKPALAKNELITIIEKAGGTVSKSVAKSNKNVLNIVIQGADEVSMGGNYMKKGNTISHKWILDSISNHTTLEYRKYLL